MAYKTEITKLVARCRRIGWEVELPPAGGATTWSHKIRCADGYILTLHKSPKDQDVAMEVNFKRLGDHGFNEAEAAWRDGDERRRREAIKTDRATNDRKTAAAAKRAKEEAAISKAAGSLGPQPFTWEWLSGKHEWPETKTGIMTPEVAQKVLDNLNTLNRKENNGRITYFENLINDGEFACTHQGGAIDWNCALQDGQSRLRAFVNLNVSMLVQWSVGMDPENFRKVDTGGQRNYKDTAYIKGKREGIDWMKDDPATSSTAARMLLAIDSFGPDAHVRSKSGRISNDTVDKALGQYGDDLGAAIRVAREIRKDVRRANLSGLSVALYLIMTRLPKGDPRVVKFLEDLGIGGSGKTEVVWKLRQKLMNGPIDRKSYNAWEAAALTIKAWNARHTQKKVTDLVWRPGNEPFPAHIFLPPPVEDAA